MTAHRIKFNYQEIDERGGRVGLPLLAVSIHRGVVRRDSITNDLPRAEDLSNYKLCRRGDIVLNRMRAFQGAVGVSPLAGLVSPDYLVLRPGVAVLPRYSHYLFRSSWLVGEMVSRLRGIGGIESGNVRTPRINADDLGEVRFDFPSLAEQARIAAFLDRGTRMIDLVADLQERLRQSLECRFQAQRDLLVEKAARTYGTLPLRRFLVSIEQGVSPQCENVEAGPGEWGVLKVSAVKRGRFIPVENKRLPLELRTDMRFKIRTGDLLITRANTPALVGSAAVVEQLQENLLLCDKIYRMRASADLDPNFLVEVVMSSRIRAMCVESAHGASQSMANLKVEEVKRWPVPAADLSVQRTVVDELRNARDHLDSLVATISRQLTLLAERRQALITAAVTGQIDVSTARGVSA